MMIPNTILSRTLFILTLGGAGGMLFYALGLPAPFMLGSVTICWLTGGFLKPLRGWLTFPWSIRFVFVVAVAVVLGSYASPDTIAGIAGWWPSLLVLGLVSVAMTWASYYFLRYVRGHDEPVAWFAAQTAGLTEVVMMAGRYTDKDYIVAFFHLVRVSSVFIVAPILVWLVADNFDTQAVPAGQLHVWDIQWWNWPLYLLVAVVGYGAARLVRLPMRMLLGPMIASALVSGSGLITFERPFEVICFIQVALGSSIGARMGQVNFRELRAVVPDAYINALFMIAVALLAATALSLLTDQPLLKLFLALSPGGVSELSLVAVALGYEVAFITLHHLFRMAVVLLAMPLKRLPPERDRG